MTAALEEQIVARLTEQKLTLSTAESCTGGLLAGRLINVPGISQIFREGYITYSNESKEKLLHVSCHTLQEFGAVSEETAREMAKGCAEAAGTDLAAAVTGIAGPDGGTAEKPVGLVYLACYDRGAIYVKRSQFSGNRAEVREAAVGEALALPAQVL